MSSNVSHPHDIIKRMADACEDAEDARKRGAFDDIEALILQQMKDRLLKGNASPRELIRMAKMVARIEGRRYRVN